MTLIYEAGYAIHSHLTPKVPPLRNKGLIAALKGRQWLISP